MTKERLFNKYNVNVDHVAFQKSANGLYEVSIRTLNNGNYIIKYDADNYDVVTKENQTSQFCCDLSDLEEKQHKKYICVKCKHEYDEEEIGIYSEDESRGNGYSETMSYLYCPNCKADDEDIWETEWYFKRK